jgi:hypothetical protein
MSDEDYAMLEELMRSYNIPTPGELIRYLIKKEHARIFIDSHARKTIATTPTKMRVTKAGGDTDLERLHKIDQALLRHAKG